jgi:hypothetical protein
VLFSLLKKRNLSSDDGGELFVNSGSSWAIATYEFCSTILGRYFAWFATKYKCVQTPSVTSFTTIM